MSLLFTGPPLKAARSPSGPGESSSSYLLEETCLVPLWFSLGIIFPQQQFVEMVERVLKLMLLREEEGKRPRLRKSSSPDSTFPTCLSLCSFYYWEVEVFYCLDSLERRIGDELPTSSTVLLFPQGSLPLWCAGFGGVLSIFCCPLNPLSTHLHPALGSRSMA